MSLLPINPEDFPDVPTRKALIAIDLQNDFLAEEGALRVTQPDGMIGKIVRLAEAVRASGYGEVIWVRSQFDTSRPATEQQIMAADSPQIPLRPGSSAAAAAARSRKPPSASTPLEADPEAFLSVYGDEGSKARKPKPQCVRKGTRGVELFPAIAAAKGPKDYAMTKSYYSAFETGQLLNLLRRQFATELYICGALSNVSVYATALAASCYGFDITIVEDCCGYRSEMRHMNAARKLSELTGCEFSTAANVIPNLRPQTPPKPPPKSTDRVPRASSAAPQIPTELIAAAMAATRGSPNKGIPVRPKPSPPRVEKSHSTEEERKEERGETGKPTALSIDLPISAEKLKLISESPVSASAPEPAVMACAAKTVTLEPKDDTAQPENEEAVQPVVKDVDVKAGVTEAPKRQASGTIAPAAAKIKPNPDPQGRPIAGSSDVAQTLLNAAPIKPHKSLLTDETGPSTKSSQLRSPKFKVTEELLVAATPAHMLKGDYTSNKIDQSPPTEPVCEGDTTLATDFLPPDLIEGLFERLCEEVQFRKMMHQGGEVPRFIAVQGEVDENGTQPVYRHPADESPPLLHFTPAVQKIREHVEKALEHPINHVLIQCYRGGNDYISEHSDKTLDIVQGSYIANVSLGAERTMVFRTKRGDRKSSVAAEKGIDTVLSKATESVSSPDAKSPTKRQVIRLPMPHNSLVKMGLATNGKWLHGIKADKRPLLEKTKAEVAWDGVRISLTFRHIGTFLSHSSDAHSITTPSAESKSSTAKEEPLYIWGQGAVAKERKSARPVINGQTPEAIAMLKAFGKENNSPDFDWDENYGCGFDVLHMKAAPRYFACGDLVIDTRVKLMLAECGVKYAKGDLGFGPSSSVSRDENGKAVVPVKFMMDDPDRTTVVGDVAILLYLDAKYPKKRGGGDAEIARMYTRFHASLALGQRWAAVTPRTQQITTDKMKGEKKTLLSNFFKSEFAELEAWAAEFFSDEKTPFVGKSQEASHIYYIAGGNTPSIADYALWPVLHDMVVSWQSFLMNVNKDTEDTEIEKKKKEEKEEMDVSLLSPFSNFGYEKLKNYYDAFGRRKSVTEVFGGELFPPSQGSNT